MGDRLAKIMTMHYLCRKLFIMLKTKDSWDKLSMFEKADLIKYAVQNGIYNPNTVRQAYNEFAEGGEKDGEMTRVRRANGEYAFVKTKNGHAITDGTGRYPLYNSSGTVIGTGVGDSFPYVGDVRDEGYLDEITVTPQGMQTQDTTYNADALLKAAQQAERNKEIARNRAIDAKVSQYAFTPEGFFDVATRPAFTLLSPTNTTRALWDIGKGVLTGEGPGNIAQRLFTHNNGWFSDDFAREHPYWTMAGNMLGDVAAFGTAAALRNMPKYRAALQAENRAAQEAMANSWDDMLNRGSIVRTKLGDAEVNNPGLYYRQGTPEMVDDFVNKGTAEAKQFPNPMFNQGSLFYNFPKRKGFTLDFNRRGTNGLIVTSEDMIPAGTDATPLPLSEIDEGLTARIPKGKVTTSNAAAYNWEPGYGYRQVHPSQTRALSWEEATTPKITAENAASITPEQWNAAYRAAYERGDRSEGQRLWDLWFNMKASKNKLLDEGGRPLTLWTSSEKPFNSFDLGHFGETDSGFFGYGFYLTPQEKYAASYHPINRPFYVNMENPYIGEHDAFFNRMNYVSDRLSRRKEIGLKHFKEGKIANYWKKRGISSDMTEEEASRKMDEIIKAETEKWKAKYVKYEDEFTGKDGVLSWRDLQGVPNKREGMPREVVVPKGEQIKSAEPFTFADDGSLIDITDRANFSKNDSRYSWLPWLLGGGTAATLYGNGQE